MNDELTFLRYFYNRARDFMGPADMDIYDTIKEEFAQDHGKLPEDYDPAYEDYI